jgi:hypothetical protein
MQQKRTEKNLLRNLLDCSGANNQASVAKISVGKPTPRLVPRAILSELLSPLSEFSVDVGTSDVVTVGFDVVSGIQLGSLHIFFRIVKLKGEIILPRIVQSGTEA